MSYPSRLLREVMKRVHKREEEQLEEKREMDLDLVLDELDKKDNEPPQPPEKFEAEHQVEVFFVSATPSPVSNQNWL